MNQRSRQLTIAALERAIADSATAPKIRRGCALRLSRLRNATTGSRTGSRMAKPLTITTRTKAAPIRPAAPAAPSEQARFEAVQSFRALSLQRTALFRKRRTAAEQDIFLVMAALMPAGVPTNDDPAAWRDFVDRIDLLLSEIKNIKPL